MNLHPIIIHFPIALLAVYSILELISVIKPSRGKKFYSTKIFCLWGGVIGSFFALQSGEVAEEIIGKSLLVHQHEEFAEKSHMIYTILSGYYIFKIAFEHKLGAKYRNPLTKHHEGSITKIMNAIWTKWLIAIIGMFGFVLLSITGALGGAISHGVGNGDPVVDLAVRLFVN